MCQHLHSTSGDIKKMASCSVIATETELSVEFDELGRSVIPALVIHVVDLIVCTMELSPLHMAAKEGHCVVADRLLQHHAPVEQLDNLGKTPLLLAASEGHVGLIDLLLEKGASLSYEDSEGLTALGCSCLRGQLSSARALLDRGAPVNHVDRRCRTPLDLAAFQGNPSLVQLLLERGAMLEHVDIQGFRPLDRAIECRNAQAVRCFLRKGAKLGPTTWTMATGKPEIMLILLNKLLEDGNVLFRKGRLSEAAHRYQYALRKFPTTNEVDSEHLASFDQLRANFLLNQARCKRKMQECPEAIELASKVLQTKPDSYEAYYARAKARIDLKAYEDALNDVQEALRVAPTHNRDVRRVLIKLREEVLASLSIP